MKSRINLLTQASGNITTKERELLATDVLVSYGGNFDGATITLQILEQGSWEPVTDGIFTAPGQKLLQLAYGIEIRAVITSAGANTSLNLSISPRH
jgi:hypothetical protein